MQGSWFAKCLSMWAVAAGLAVLGSTGCGGRPGGPAGASARDACLPPGDDVTYQLSTVGGRTQLCQTPAGAGDDGRPRACWTVDLATGDVRATDIAVVPGRGRRVPAAWTPEGLCADGYCVPAERTGAEGGDDEAEPLVELAVGARAAVMLGAGGERFHLFDERKRLRPLPDPGDRDDGPSAAADDPLIVDDVIFIGDYDAGPHADIHVYDVKGQYLGAIRDPAAEEEYSGYFELWNGSVSVISDHEVAFAEYLLARVLVFDTRLKRVTQVWNRRSGELPPGSGCTEEMTAVFFDPIDSNLEYAREEGQISSLCLAELQRLEGRFGPLGMVRGGEGGALGLVALAHDPLGWALVHFDGDGVVQKDVKLARCAVTGSS